jgi:hypothetical protein
MNDIRFKAERIDHPKPIRPFENCEQLSNIHIQQEAKNYFRVVLYIRTASVV